MFLISNIKKFTVHFNLGILKLIISKIILGTKYLFKLKQHCDYKSLFIFKNSNVKECYAV